MLYNYKRYLMKTVSIPAFFFFLTLLLSGCKENSTEPTGAPGNISVSRYDIIEDNNGDAAANPGETIRLKLYVKNFGNNPAKKVYISQVKSLSDYVWTSIDNYSYDINNAQNIDGGQEIIFGGETPLKLLINKDAKADATYKILIQFKDENRTEWNDTLDLIVSKTGAKIMLSRYEIIFDNNGNKKANPGEFVGISLFLKNIGSAKANGVKILEINSLTDYLKVWKSDYQYELSYGSIFTEQEMGTQNNVYIRAEIRAGIKADTIFKIGLQIGDAEGNVWNDTLTLYVERSKADLKISGIEIRKEENMDGKPNPGENLGVLVYVKNNGSDRANEVKIIDIQYNSQLVILYSYQEELTYGDILPGEEISYGGKNERLYFTVKPTTPIGAILPFTLTFRDAEGNEWQDSFEMKAE